jgi:hypothetical protein
MNSWILILFLTGMTQGGEAIHSVKFKTQAGCYAALAKLPTENEIFSTYGRKSLYGICVEDK